MRLGLESSAAGVRLAVVDGGEVAYTAEVPPQRDLRAGLAAARASLPRAIGAAVTEVRIAAVPGAEDLELGALGHVRIAAPTMPALAPFASWPASLVAELGGRVATVTGGSDFVGNSAAAAPEVQLRGAKERLLAAGATRLTVAAAGATSAPWIERQAASVLAAGEVALATAVTPAHTIGGTGLREREHAAVLNAGLRGWAERVVSDARTVFPDLPIGFAHGLGGFGSPEELVRFPLGSVHGRVRAAALGVMRLRGVNDAVLAVLDPTRSVLVGLTSGVLDRADVERLWGITHNSLALDLVELGTSESGDQSLATLAPGDLAATPELARVLARRPGYPVVAVGAVAAVHGAEPFAIALGAALGTVTVALERVVPRPPGGEPAASHGATGLIEEAKTRAILAGADPLRLGEATVDRRPLAYVADRVDTVRVRVNGAPE